MQTSSQESGRSPPPKFPTPHPAGLSRGTSFSKQACRDLCPHLCARSMYNCYNIGEEDDGGGELKFLT